MINHTLASQLIQKESLDQAKNNVNAKKCSTKLIIVRKINKSYTLQNK